ncbi:MAG: BA14K family protein [Hyphomicrobiales bacterium]
MFKSSIKAIGLAIVAGVIGLMAGSMSANASSYLAGKSIPAVAGDRAVEGNVQLTGNRRGARRGNRGARRANRGARRHLRRGNRANRRNVRRAYRKGYRRGYRKGNYRGKRYRHRRYGYNHFYGGYWYPYAWWVGPAIGATVVIQNRANTQSSHVDWCLNRYRSYNPRTDTFLAYSGRYKPCISPYSY